MFNFIKKIFIHPEQEVPPNGRFPLSATPNSLDNRDIGYATANVYVALPETYKTDDSAIPHINQYYLGVCVAATFDYATRLMSYLATGIVKIFRLRFLYVLARRFVGYINGDALAGQGLPAREAAKILTTVGICEGDNEENDNDIWLPHSTYVDDFVVTDEMKKSANINRAGGFTFPRIDIEELKQAIYNVKVVPVTIKIDWDAVNKDGTICAPFSKVDGYHEVALIGWDQSRFIFRNWWGSNWGDKGYGYIPFSQAKGVIVDALAFQDIPDNLIERAKKTQFIFLEDVHELQYSGSVRALQTRLKEYGVYDYFVTGFFGTITKAAVRQYQKIKGISQTGYVGTLTRAALNADQGVGVEKSKIDLWCEAIREKEGWHLPGTPNFPRGSLSYQNNNPGNLRYVGQSKATGKDSQNFCIFATYADGYMTLRDMLVRWCTPPDVDGYRANMTLLEVMERYAPKSDGNDPVEYAKFVASYMGVTPETVISTFI